MELTSIPTDIILAPSQQPLDRVCLNWTPQPGSYLTVQESHYLVLERRHRYHLKGGRYRLHTIALYVQQTHLPSDRTYFEGRWVVGDPTCRFNAHSELLRCAVNPSGPCGGCAEFAIRLSENH